MSFRKRLIELMDQNNLTVKQAASFAGVNPSTLQAWRSGSLPTNFNAVKKLANQFGKSLTWILTGEEDDL